MQSVELLLDPATDAAVRRQWAVLSDAGLPSQQDHRGPTNAPHVTVVLAPRTSPAAEEALAGAADLLEVPLRLGGLLVLGRRRLVLARQVVVTPALLDVHTAAARAWADLPDLPDHTRLGRWTPHVTLARNLHAEQVGAALAALQQDGVHDTAGAGTILRRWDPVTRRAWTV